MIAGLRGIVDEVGPDFVLVNVGGIVFQVFASSSTLAEVTGSGLAISLHTHMQVREDGVTLFGFATRAERQEFQLLIGVTGVGPRIALALLSAFPAEQLLAVIASEDAARLSSVTGVGKRIAGRIVLELKSKVGQIGAGVLPPAASAATSQLLAALTTLGYSSAEAAEAVRSIPNLGAMELEDGLREALRVLSAQK